MARWLLFLALLSPQDADPQRLILQLGDDDPVVREHATKGLETLGDAALDPLLKAAGHSDFEIRSRASAILRRIDQALYFRSLALVQRPRKIFLFAGQWVPREAAAVTDGAEFEFERQLRTVEGKVQGSVISTRIRSLLRGELEWSVAAVRSGKELALETCSIHSPASVYVPGDSSEPVTVVIKGVRRWLCDVPVVFTEPAEGDLRRIGPFTLTLKWPHLEVHAEGRLPATLTAMMLRSEDIQGRPHPGREKATAELQPRQPTDEPAIFFPEAKEAPRAWCGCENQADRSAPSAWKSWRRLVPIPASDSSLLHHLSSLYVVFHMPVEEPFEVTSPPLK